jgi:hypothetical protein
MGNIVIAAADYHRDFTFGVQQEFQDWHDKCSLKSFDAIDTIP